MSMRFTVIDHHGSISFVGDARMLDALVAACTPDPASHAHLFSVAQLFDKRIQPLVLNGLAIFDEHNTPDNPAAIDVILRETRGQHTPPFRVIDEITRNASLQPVSFGLVLFNLPARRIVQVQNSYREVLRSGAVEIHDGVRWTRRGRRYAVPKSWSILP